MGMAYLSAFFECAEKSIGTRIDLMPSPSTADFLSVTAAGRTRRRGRTGRAGLRGAGERLPAFLVFFFVVAIAYLLRQ
jgi:hypothetical protein